jgi:hypothetical protein
MRPARYHQMRQLFLAPAPISSTCARHDESISPPRQLLHESDLSVITFSGQYKSERAFFLVDAVMDELTAEQFKVAGSSQDDNFAFPIFC